MLVYYLSLHSLNKKDLPRKLMHVLYCLIKMHFFLFFFNLLHVSLLFCNMIAFLQLLLTLLSCCVWCACCQHAVLTLLGWFQAMSSNHSVPLNYYAAFAEVNCFWFWEKRRKTKQKPTSCQKINDGINVQKAVLLMCVCVCVCARVWFLKGQLVLKCSLVLACCTHALNFTTWTFSWFSSVEDVA